ncbi:hypothetical protein ABZ923_23245 [Streptomyces sp. NPDC046881]|uniref:hypothetical protein n=1 Tax=Streptomyces sp. NPDC046881 TaxID=3155374 RepID=UPI0033CB6973
MARSPLESPRAFPGRLLPLVQAVTGATTATYTTGPATRLALTAAGAHGATTRTTVHLPAEPGRADPALLAHELSHARSPLLRPRFSLRAPVGTSDADERAAQAAGFAVRRAVTGGLGGLANVLPVGGASAGATALVDAATRAARDAVREEVERALSTADRAGTAATAGTPSFGGADGYTGGAPDARTSLRTGSAAADTTAATTAAPGAAEAPGARRGLAAPAGQPSLDEIVRAVEERVLHQLERRGGRYAGTF